MQTQVPSVLKKWFVVHCIIDLVFVIPLFFFPERFLALLDWPFVDPLTTRLVAAALFGIGLESYLGRNAGPDNYRGMLRLKILWSAAATLGILWTLFGMPEPPVVGWLLAAVFAGFNVLWVYWYRVVTRNAVS
jgi:hypothetical protein